MGALYNNHRKSKQLLLSGIVSERCLELVVGHQHHFEPFFCTFRKDIESSASTIETEPRNYRRGVFRSLDEKHIIAFEVFRIHEVDGASLGRHDVYTSSQGQT